jgi:hypothetical protein
MPTDPKSGTVAEVAASKKRQYVIYEIDIGSGRKDICAVRGDVVDYFNMGGGTTTGQNYKIINRATTGRELFVDLQDTTGRPSATGTTNKFALPKALTVGGGGQIITVPTELKTTKGNIRTVRMHFPSKAILAAISNFLFIKCTAHKPTFFISPKGVRRAVVAIPSGDINASEPAAPTPP